MTAVHLNPTAHVGREFARFIKALARTRGDALGAEAFAVAQGWGTCAAVLKAVVDPMMSSDLVDQAMAPMTSDLVGVLRPLTILGRLQGMRHAPFHTRLLTQNVGGSGDWVAEGDPIPVSSLGIADTVTLIPKRVAGIRVLTVELLNHAASRSDALVANDAASALVEAMDRGFIDPANAGTAAKPASISWGAQEYSSGGATVAAIDLDLARLLAVLTGADCNLSTAAWVMSPVTATFMALLRGTAGPSYPGMTARGGFLLGLPVLTSTVIAASGSPGERYIVLAEASEIIIADDGQATVELSTRAAVQMDDAPASGSQQLVSLWQAGLVGIKATRLLEWSRRRDGAVAVLRDVAF